MIKLGLTGSIGMGKSTTAKMFADKGIPVYDADATVHNLYADELVFQIEEAFPGTTDESGVNRAKLSAAVLGRTDQMRKLEAIVHPAVQAKEQQFLIEAQENGAALVVLDIPLLFETGGEVRVDKIAVVTAPAEVQRERVLTRDGMSEEKFENILKRQIPDEEKRERADFLVFTHKGLEVAEAQVAEIIEQLSK